MTCSDEEITKRLKARPAERMCGEDAFIKEQMTILDVADKIADFIKAQI